MKSRVIPCLFFHWAGSPLIVSVLFCRASFLDENSERYLCRVVSYFEKCSPLGIVHFLQLGWGPFCPLPAQGRQRAQGWDMSGPAQAHMCAHHSPFTAYQSHFCSPSPNPCCLVVYSMVISSSLLNSKLSGYKGSTFIRTL